MYVHDQYHVYVYNYVIYVSYNGEIKNWIEKNTYIDNRDNMEDYTLIWWVRYMWLCVDEAQVQRTTCVEF